MIHVQNKIITKQLETVILNKTTEVSLIQIFGLSAVLTVLFYWFLLNFVPF